MHKTRYWLLLKIAQMPQAFVYGTGLLTALGLVLASIVTTIQLDRNLTAQRHDQAMHLYQQVVSESTGLLAHLIAHNDQLSCSDADLMHLDSHLIRSRHLREIGLLDDDRRLICSTAMGKLPKPLKDGYPVIVSRSGLQLMNNVPLSMANKQLSALIIQRPPFNVAVSPYATDDLYASSDAVWLRTHTGLELLNTPLEPAAVTSMRKRARLSDKPSFTLHGLSYELISSAPNLDLVLQTQRTLGMIVRQRGSLLLSLLLGSLLIALLAAGAITPYIRRRRKLRNRIAFLCDEAHLVLVYQPIFDLTTMRPIGCEVLARLKEGKRIWKPDQLIPALQEAGLEEQFDHAVTKKAIRELAQQVPARNEPFKIALNYFPKSVNPDKLTQVLTQALESTGRSDLAICLEITEHNLSSELISEVRSLKEKGFDIAVDDFGTGYSNLKTVTQLSPNFLKIDRSFVYELEESTLRSNLIPEIVDIGRAVNAQIVAEGIERLEQVRLLTAAGVRYGQGYALARPMRMTQFIAFITNSKVN